MIVTVFAIVIMLPALWHGWVMDDAGFRARFLGTLDVDEALLNGRTPYSDISTLGAATANLYSFFGGEKATEALMDYGTLPWWASPDLKISFWRPVTAFTIWLDYQLFPDSGPLQHLHSILWFALAVLLLAYFYRRLVGPVWIASLAVFVYALDDCNYLPAAFLAQRNSVIALVFCLLTLLMHDRWRRDNSRAAAFLAVPLLALSLLSAEAGIATMAYLVAYAMMLDAGKWRHRLLSLTPYIATVVVWRIIYRSLEYGTLGSGMYIDPASEPWRFIEAAAERGPILLFTQLMGSSADMYYFFNHTFRLGLLVFSAAMLVALLLVLLPLLRKNRQARFFLLGMLLATVPICATIASNRNLMFVGIGAMGLVALFLGAFAGRYSYLPARRLWRVGAWLFCILFVLNHLIAAGAVHLAAPWMYQRFGATSKIASDIPCPPEVRKQDLVVVNSPSPLMMMGIPVVNALEDRPSPRSIRCLAPAFGSLEAERIDETSLIIRAIGRNLLFSNKHEQFTVHPVYFLEEFNTILRAPQLRFTDEWCMQLPGMSARVIRLDEHSMPVEVRFTFAVPLEDPSLRWVRFDVDGRRYVPFKPPAIGHVAEL